MPAMDVIIAALIALCLVAVGLVLYLRAGGKLDSGRESEDASKLSTFDTTLGEFHDMRKALRPLQHTRATSRRVPGQP
jgi:hypothetical protein